MSKLLNSTTIVVDPNGKGHVRTIDEAITALGPNGGSIALAKGNHSITAPIAVNGDRQYSFRGLTPADVTNSGVASGPCQILLTPATSYMFQLGLGAPRTLDLDFKDVFITYQQDNQALVRVEDGFPTASYCYLHLENSTVSAQGRTGCRLFNTPGAGGGSAEVSFQADNSVIIVNLFNGPSNMAFSAKAVNSYIRGSMSGPYPFIASNCDLGAPVSGGSLRLGGTLASPCILTGCKITGLGPGLQLVFGNYCTVSGCIIRDDTNVVTISGGNSVWTGCSYVGVGLNVTQALNIFAGMSILTTGYAITETQSNRYSEIEPPAGGTYTLTLAGTTGYLQDVNAKVVNTTPYAVVIQDRVLLVDASGGARAVNLPAASGLKYRVLKVKKTDSSVNAVTIDANGAETIDGQLTAVLALQYQYVVLLSDGTNWQVIAQGEGGLSLGGLKTAITSVAADTVLDFSYATVTVDATAAARTITLPNATTCRGRVYTVKKSDAGANTVTLASGGGTIDGAATQVIRQQYASLTVQSDGTNWVII